MLNLHLIPSTPPVFHLTWNENLKFVQAGTSTTSAGVVGSGGAGGLQNLIRAYQAGHSWLVEGEHRAALNVLCTPRSICNGVLNSLDMSDMN